MMRRAIVVLAVALLAAGTTSIAVPPPPAALVRWTAAPRLPVVTAYRYTLTARVRPLLLFWITRANVGEGRIVRGQAPDGARSYELLIGSDPAKAPMRFNRWGYISEVTQQGTTLLVGLMTESTEETVEQAQAALNQQSRGGHPFKAIRASIGGGQAAAQVVRVAFTEDFTLRDLQAVLGRLPEGGEPTARVQVPAGTSPGFLVAVAELIHASADVVRASGRVPRGGSQAFVYDRALYTLSVTRSRLVPQLCSGSTTWHNCIESEFEVRNRATGTSSEFQLTYGIDGPLAEVPVRIVYRPRWYFEAQLTLEGWQ